MRLQDLKVDIYADGADIGGMERAYRGGLVRGFTTNPTLMKKAGVKSYTEFARAAVERLPGLPISFEVFADDFGAMEEEALALSQYGRNVFVKIPVTNTKGETCAPLAGRLARQGVNLNITAIFTAGQAEKVLEALGDGGSHILSVFAGRVADTGADPEIIMGQVAALCRRKGNARSLWASCREVFNIVQADRCGADIITVTDGLLEKLGYFGKDLEQFSLETVQMFERDGRSLGFSIIGSPDRNI